jgi:hypothetical protein
MTDTPTIDRPRSRKRALRRLNAAQRRRIEAAVQAMIDALDAIDAPAEDLEEVDHGGPGDEDDEPALGWTDAESAGAGFNYGAAISGQEDEPSLGSLAVYELVSQASWAHGRNNDAEDEHDGREPDVDDEPSLGSFDRMTDQTKSWFQSARAMWFWVDAEDDPAEREGEDEREQDPAEDGIGDLDGLAEQTQRFCGTERFK